jgi:hypothetical protein
MATTTARSRKIAKAVSVATGFGLGIVAVLGFSNSAFSAQTNPNAQNNWATAGSVSLTSQFTAPLFSFGLDGVGKPTSAGVQKGQWDNYLDTTGTSSDIDITYVGEVNADVRMFVANKGTATNGLDAHTLVTVTRDPDGAGAQPAVTIYNGVPLSTMPTSYTAAASAEASHWNVDYNAASKKATYSVSIKTDATAPTASTVRGVQLQWEAQQR